MNQILSYNIEVLVLNTLLRGELPLQTSYNPNRAPGKLKLRPVLTPSG